jgi:hypothetical protein
MSGAGEAGHVYADLGEDAFGSPLPDPGDRVEPVTGLLERDTGLAGVGGEQGVDALIEPGDRRLEVVDVVQAQPDQHGVVVTESAGQRLAQRRHLVAQLSLG